MQKAYKLKPDDLNTIITLGVVYEELKLFSAMDSLFDAALVIFPDNALLLNNYSYSLGERGVQLQRALEMSRRAVELEPENGAYLDTIGWIHFKLGNYHEALQFIKKAINTREESAEVLEHLGDVYYQLGEIDNAQTYWRKALEKDPGNQTLKDKLRTNSTDQ